MKSEPRISQEKTLRSMKEIFCRLVQLIKKKKRGYSDQCEASHGYVGGKWVAQPAQNYV